MNSDTAGRRILLIEDEMLVAGMLQGMLASLGYSVAGTTADADEAMQLLGRESVDAVVLDINLNGEMSYPIADALAARGIPFIFSTGYEPQSLPAKHEGRPLLKKPFRRSALGGALADLLRRERRQSEWPHAIEPDRPAAARHDNGGSLLPGLAGS